MSTYYILYDLKKIHWFSSKEGTDKRNLQAIKNKMVKQPNLINEEITISKDIESEIKFSLFTSFETVLSLIRQENPHILPIYFPQDLY